MERKVVVLRFHFSLIGSFQTPRETVSHSGMTSFVTVSLFLQPRSHCSVSSPQSRSLFPYSLQSAVVGGAAQPVQSVCLRSNGFSLRCALAITLVCVFKCSEKLPFGCLGEGDSSRVGIWLH